MAAAKFITTKSFNTPRNCAPFCLESSTVAPPWPSTFHVGFGLPSRADVESLHAQMVADGVIMETAVIEHQHGSRFFCRAPGGVMFDLNTRADAAFAYRGTFD